MRKYIELLICVLFYIAAIWVFVAVCTTFIEEGDQRAQAVRSLKITMGNR